LAWDINVTDEYAAWFGHLIKEDLASASQIAQAVAALGRQGRRSAREYASDTEE
jgi:hypothetical protein